MSRGTKSKAISGEKDSPSQDEYGSGDMKMADLFPMINVHLDKQDNKFVAFYGEIKNSNHRLDELQLRVQQPRPAEMGIQEEKSGELDEIATEAGG